MNMNEKPENCIYIYVTSQTLISLISIVYRKIPQVCVCVISTNTLLVKCLIKVKCAYGMFNMLCSTICPNALRAPNNHLVNHTYVMG
jgi:hypothetical protein